MSHLSDAQLFTYLDDELTAAEKRPLAAHLATCPACAAKLNAWQTLFGEVEALPVVPLTVDLSDNVVEAVTAETSLTTSPAVRWFGIVEVAFAAFALMIGWPWIGQVVGKMRGVIGVGWHSAEISLTLPVLTFFTQAQTTFERLPTLPISLALTLALLVATLIIWLATARLLATNLIIPTVQE